MLKKEITRLTKGRVTNYSSLSPYLATWAGWYSGFVSAFHNYKINNGVRDIILKRKSLQMAKKVCEDWADLLLNERCNIVLPNEDAQVEFERLLDKTLFWVTANESIEHSFALGYGALVLGVKNVEVGSHGTINKTGELKVDFVNRLHITPLSYEGKNIVEAMFTFSKDKYKEHIIHLRDEQGNYNIYTYAEAEGKINLISQFNTGSALAWFQIIRPNISSNLIYNEHYIEPYISIFANSIDVLMAIDTKYDSFDNEFIAGRKRIFVTDESAVVTNKKGGGQFKTFDPLTTTYHILPASNDNKQYIKDESGSLRAGEHILAIDRELNILANKTGMGEAYYKFDGSGDVTATQVVSENSKLFRNLKKHEIPLEYSLINLTIAMIEASQRFTDKPINITPDKYVDIVVMFDDSIIEDKGTELDRDRILVADGLLSPVEFREKWLGENYDTATENYRKYFKYDIFNKYLPALQTGALSPAEFVLEVYGVVDETIVKYIEDNLDRGVSNIYNDINGLYGSE